MNPHISTVIESERIVVTGYGRQEYFRVKLDCGHQDDISAGTRRRCPTLWRCTECELSAGRTGKDAA